MSVVLLTFQTFVDHDLGHLVSTTYSSVDKTAQYLSDVSPYPRRKIIPLLFPNTLANIITTFQEFAVLNPTVPGKKTVVIIDAIVSNPGVKLPWKELVSICKEHDFLSVIDAAHSLGQETNIDLGSAQPDFWVSVRPFLQGLFMGNNLLFC